MTNATTYGSDLIKPPPAWSKEVPESVVNNEQEERIARRAAELLKQDLFVEIGKHVVEKVFWFVGLVAAGLWALSAGPIPWSQWFSGDHK